MSHTIRHNINRGFMKLEIWKRAQELVGLTAEILKRHPDVSFKIRDQLLDAAMSIPSNISEGYCRRSIREYVQFCYAALGSSGEALSRTVSPQKAFLISNDDLVQLENAHWDVENLIVALVRSLERKRDEGSWDDQMA
jgi:four helix bundle protein